MISEKYFYGFRSIQGQKGHCVPNHLYSSKEFPIMYEKMFALEFVSHLGVEEKSLRNILSFQSVSGDHGYI